MRHHPLGRTGLFVSELCLGTMTFGGGEGIWGQIGALQQADAERLVGQCARCRHQLHRHRRRLFGRPVGADHRPGAEEPEGAARRRGASRPRCSARPAAGPNARGASRGHIMDGVKASLKRLQLDHIDLYQIHGFDPATPIEETVRALDQLVRHGHVRYVGVSNWAAWQIVKALGIAERLRPGALRIAAGLLHGRRPRPRARAHPDAGQRRRRADGLEPAGRRPAQRQVRPRAARPKRAAAAPPSTSRRCNRDRAYDCIDAMRADRRRRTACRWRRWRSPGCCTSRRSPA